MTEGSLELLYQAYFDSQYEMLEKVKPEVVGHFDLIRMFTSDFPLSVEVWAKITRNIVLIKSFGGLVEVNSRGWKKDLKSAYPKKDILELMKQMEVKFTLSDDCHGPNDVGMHYGLLFKYLREMGIERVFDPLGKEYIVPLVYPNPI